MFFVSQALSNIGTWSHELARAWLVLEMTSRATGLGTLLLAVALPSLVLMLKGGAIVDGVSPRRVMIVTKSVLAVSAFLLTFLVESDIILFWHLLVFAVLEGIVASFDHPSYAAMLVRLVPKPEFARAITLNSTNFHMSRMMGPLVAGLAMALYGPGLVFLLDGLSYIFIVYMLWKIRLLPKETKNEDSGIATAGVRVGIKYFFQTPELRYLLIQLFLTVCLLFPIMLVIVRTYFRQKFQLDGEHFGYLFSLPAIGAFIGAVALTLWPPAKPLKLLIYSIPLSSVFLTLLIFLPNIGLVSCALVVVGVFTYLNFMAITLSLHLSVKDEFRGRLGAFVGMAFVSFGPLMSFPVGYLSENIGFISTTLMLVSSYLILSGILGYKHFAKRHRMGTAAA